MTQRQFLIIFEKGETNYGAYSPDLPGCVAVGKTKREAEKHMREAIKLHIKGMLEDGLPIPKGSASTVNLVLEVDSAKRSGSRTAKSIRVARGA
jgi:predicted RNase H-like HicB family nuclease